MSAELTKPLIVSMVGPLMNKIKCAIKYARKNIKFGDVITPTIELLGEQLIPFYCAGQNWDLKGMKQVLMRIFKVLGVHGVETLS